MKFRGLLAATVILLVLAGLLYWSRGHKKPTGAVDKRPVVVKIAEKDVQGLTFRAPGAKPIVVTRSGAKRWKIESPGLYPANESTVGSVLSSLTDFRAQRIVTKNAANLGVYGLSQPTFQLVVEEQDHKATTISFGGKSPTSDDTYVSVSGNPDVYLVESWTEGSFDKKLDHLRDRHLMPVTSDSVKRIDLTRKGHTIQFDRVGKGWQIEKPEKYRTDTFQVDDLLEQVVGAQWETSTVPAQAQAAYEHGMPVATVILTGSSGSQTLDVREQNGDYYAHSTAAPGIWKIQPAVGEVVTRSLNSFRNKQLFDFGYNDPDKVEVHDGKKALFLARQGSTWWSVGQKMNSGSVEDLVSTLRALAATKFVDSGFQSPTIQLTVNSDGGKKTETVEIEKTKNGGIAKRTDGKTLYAIDPDTLSMLKNSIDAVKPAAVAKAKK